MGQAKRTGGTIRVTIRDGDRMVQGDYMGGPYVDLYFGHYRRVPTEVINVWDDETDTPRIQVRQSDIKAVVKDWMREMDEEWPEWYEGYLENARYA